MSFSLKAPAKINWFLSVLNRRDDGYHNIVSIMQCIDLFDEISFEHADDIELASDLQIPAADNLVYKAAVLLREVSGYKKGARISLKKNIPVTAGLGGGSSDAAYTFFGLNRLWKLDMRRNELMKLCSVTGSDVPFFLGNACSLIEGRGEKVTSLDISNAFVLLLVKPDISISAASAYNMYKGELKKKSIDIKLFSLALKEMDFSLLRKMVVNDLEEQVVGKYPVIGRIKEMLLENGAVLSSMSGSGPTVFGVFKTYNEAVNASGNMGEHWCRVVKTISQK